MTPARRALVLRASIAIGAPLLHYVLGAYLAEHRVIAGILAAGPHTSLLSLLLAVVFVLLRLFVLLALPGLVLVWIAAALIDARYGSDQRSPSSLENPPAGASRKR